MPQQHNPGRHVQSLTLPQSRHNHRNTSAYIFPTVPTPRTTPPAPGPNAPTQFASAIQDTSPPPHNGSTVPKPRTIPPTPEPATPRRRAPTLQHSAATRQRHSRHFPTAAQRPPHHPDASNHPADTGPRLAAGHCPASPPGPNAPTPRRNAPAPFKAHTCRRTPVPTIPTPRTTPPTPGPAPRRALPRLTAGPQCSNSPSQLARLIQDTPLPPHNGPTPSQPSDHPAGAGFNRTAGHKKIRLCEPDLFICQ